MEKVIVNNLEKYGNSGYCNIMTTTCTLRAGDVIYTSGYVVWDDDPWWPAGNVWVQLVIRTYGGEERIRWLGTTSQIGFFDYNYTITDDDLYEAGTLGYLQLRGYTDPATYSPYYEVRYEWEYPETEQPVYVYNQAGWAIALATVVCSNGTTLTTDSNGFCVFDGLDPQTEYTYTASKSGYECFGTYCSKKTVPVEVVQLYLRQLGEADFVLDSTPVLDPNSIEQNDSYWIRTIRTKNDGDLADVPLLRIYVDGTPVDTYAGSQSVLPDGVYTFQDVMEPSTGYAVGEHTIGIGFRAQNASDPFTWNVYDIGTLTVEAPLGYLDVSSTPTGARIWIDYGNTGTFVYSGYQTNISQLGVPVGTHRVQVRKTGYNDSDIQTATVSSGATVPLSFTLSESGKKATQLTWSVYPPTKAAVEVPFDIEALLTKNYIDGINEKPIHFYIDDIELPSSPILTADKMLLDGYAPYNGIALDSAGLHEVKAVFLGDSEYLSSSVAKNVTVELGAIGDFVSYNKTISPGMSIPFHVVIKNIGQAFGEFSVEVLKNGESLGWLDDLFGLHAWTNLDPGKTHSYKDTALVVALPTDVFVLRLWRQTEYEGGGEPDKEVEIPVGGEFDWTKYLLYGGAAVGGLIVVGLLLKRKGGMSISILPPIRESQTINKNGEQF